MVEGAEHFYATYQLVSTWPTTYRDFIGQVGRAIGKDIVIDETAKYEDMVDFYCKLIFGKLNVDLRHREGPARLLLYYNERGLPGSPRPLESFLNRPATTPAQLTKLKLADLKH